jgi:hypothetical protein
MPTLVAVQTNELLSACQGHHLWASQDACGNQGRARDRFIIGPLSVLSLMSILEGVRAEARE